MASGNATISGDCIPRLPRGVRLRYDERRGEWMLLAPERILKPDGIAIEILKRCDGQTSLDSIIDDLSKQFQADRAEVARDVCDFVSELAAKRVIEV